MGLCRAVCVGRGAKNLSQRTLHTYDELALKGISEDLSFDIVFSTVVFSKIKIKRADFDDTGPIFAVHRDLTPPKRLRRLSASAPYCDTFYPPRFLAGVKAPIPKPKPFDTRNSRDAP